jgi:hypothetical protein
MRKTILVAMSAVILANAQIATAARWRPRTNTAPTISGSPLTSVQAGSTYSFTPSARDAQNNALRFSITNKPAWATFSTSSGKLTGTAGTTQVGSYSNIVISVSDGQLSASLPAFTITVVKPAAANSAPTISGTPATSVQAGNAYLFTPTASDADGDPLTFSIANQPVWATFSSSSGRLSGSPSSAQAGTYSNIVISVSDGKSSKSLSVFAITVNATITNSPPAISGTPATSVDVGKAYSFVPLASDANGDALGFSITGRPTWATFNVATGALTGIPGSSQAGTYTNISITVSDGKASASLTPFSITVSQPAVGGSASLSWTLPTKNTDGSALTDLAGFKIYHGLSVGAMTDVVTVPGATATTYTFSQLVTGTHYFAISAYTSSGVEGALSAVGSKTLP